MACISLGKFDKSLIPIGIGCVFSFLSRLLFNYDGTILFKHSIIPNFLAAFAKLFTLIPLLILKVRSKRIKNLERINQVNLINKNSKQKIKLGKYLFILLNSTIYFVQGITLTYTVKIRTNFWIFDIFLTSVFYYLIFKIRLYRHHYLSLGIITEKFIYYY